MVSLNPEKVHPHLIHDKESYKEIDIHLDYPTHRIVGRNGFFASFLFLYLRIKSTPSPIITKAPSEPPIAGPTTFQFIPDFPEFGCPEAVAVALDVATDATVVAAVIAAVAVAVAEAVADPDVAVATEPSLLIVQC